MRAATELSDALKWPRRRCRCRHLRRRRRRRRLTCRPFSGRAAELALTWLAMLVDVGQAAEDSTQTNRRDAMPLFWRLFLSFHLVQVRMDGQPLTGHDFHCVRADCNSLAIVQRTKNRRALPNNWPPRFGGRASLARRLSLWLSCRRFHQQQRKAERWRLDG